MPCVALCPAGVDIPGYVALVARTAATHDAVRLIRKDNPFPIACAYICEHPCEARCRRNMIDDAINIRGLKRFAVDNAGDVPSPACAAPTGQEGRRHRRRPRRPLRRLLPRAHGPRGHGL